MNYRVIVVKHQISKFVLAISWLKQVIFNKMLMTMMKSTLY